MIVDTSDAMHIRVTNTGVLAGEPGKRGIGLANSLERLRLLFGDRVRFQLRQLEPNEVVCDVEVPLAARQPESAVTPPAAAIR